MTKAMTIKSKTILLLLICSMVPLVAVGLEFFGSARAALETQVMRVLQADSDATMGRLEDFLDKAAIDFTSWSTAPAMQDVLIDDGEQLIAGLLIRLRKQYPHFGAFMVAGDTGAVITASDAALIGRTIDGSDTFEAAMRGERIASYGGSSDLVEFENIVFAAPIRANYDRESIIGVLIGFVDWGWLRQMLADTKVVGAAQGRHHFLILMDRQRGQLLYRSEHVATDIHVAKFKTGVNENAIAGADALASTSVSLGRKNFEDPGWTMHTVVTTDVAYADVHALRSRFILIAALVALLVSIVGFFGANTLSGPIVRLTRVMGELAKGRLDVALPPVSGSDEVARMAEAVAVFKENAIARQRLEEEQAQAKQQVEAEKRAAVLALADHFENSVKGVVDTLSLAAADMQSTAQQMSGTAQATSKETTAVATASDQATANVQTVAATVEELSASIGEIARQVEQSAKIGANAVAEAEATDSTVRGLSEAAAEIGEVVSLINEIAGQTNLLALNATIEAARAGEAGKGFAVVAQEVKNLANQTARATDEIATQIGAIQGETQQAVAAIRKIREVIDEISDISTTIASAVEEQGMSTKEISRNVHEAAKGTQAVNENIERVARTASETGTASGQVLSTSQEVARQAQAMRDEVNRFLEGVRTA